MSGQDYNSQEKDILKRFKKVTFFGYFDTFDEIQRFLKVLMVGFFVLMLVASTLCAFLYVQVNNKTLAIVRQANAVQLYLHQQKIINLQSYTLRLAADFATISYFNVDVFKKTLTPFILPDQAEETFSKLEQWTKVIQAGKIVRQLQSIDYERVDSREVASYDGHSTFRVQVPMTILASKKGFDRRKKVELIFEATIAVYEPTLSNPYGLYILEFGTVDDQI